MKCAKLNYIIFNVPTKYLKSKQKGRFNAANNRI